MICSSAPLEELVVLLLVLALELRELVGGLGRTSASVIGLPLTVASTRGAGLGSSGAEQAGSVDAQGQDQDQDARGIRRGV